MSDSFFDSEEWLESMGNNDPDRMKFDEFFNYRLEKKERLTRSDTATINRKICEEFVETATKGECDKANAYLYDELANDNRRWRKDHGYSEEESINIERLGLIANDFKGYNFNHLYMRNLIESTPNEIIVMGKRLYDDAVREEKLTMEDIFNRVYALDTYDFSDTPSSVTCGRKNISLISDDTRALLGEQYEAFGRMKLAELQRDLAIEHTRNSALIEKYNADVEKCRQEAGLIPTSEMEND